MNRSDPLLHSEAFWGLDPRSRPLYTVAQAARLADVPAPTARSWVFGRRYPRAGGEMAEWQPLIEPPGDPQRRLSFWNLLELLALRVLRTIHQVKIPAVREALEVAQLEFGIERLLIHEDLRTAAGRLFLDRYGQLIRLDRSDRLSLNELWDRSVERIEFDAAKLAVRLRPRLRDLPLLSSVVIDPAISFGRPTLHGIRTDVLRSRYEAGEELDELAVDFGLRQLEVKEAILFDQLAA